MVLCTKCGSDRSFKINRSDDRKIATIEAISRVDDRMPSLGNARMAMHEAGEVLDLSKGCQTGPRSVVKVELGCCRSCVRSEEELNGNGAVFGQHRYNCCSFGKQIEDGCRQQCAGSQRLARAVREDRTFNSLPEFAKNPGRKECAPRDCGGSPPCCCPSSDSDFHQKNNGGVTKIGSARCPTIQKRDKVMPCPPLGRRVTHPLLKEDVDKRDVRKNPDGTSPVRTTGSSYGVVQRSPFTKGMQHDVTLVSAVDCQSCCPS